MATSRPKRAEQVTQVDDRVAAPIIWEQSADGVVTLVLDAPDAPVNTISSAYLVALADLVGRLELVQDKIRGVIIRSAKRSFLAGGDLNRLMDVDPAAVGDFVSDLDLRKSYTRRLELLRCPVVAIVNGSALGGGLELALCCHRSIAIDEAGAVAGLPESTLGLIPGAGGIVRVVGRLGIDRALDDVILPGRRFSLREAVQVGLLDEVVGSVEEADAAALRWISENGAPPRRAGAGPASQPRPLPPATAVPVARAITAAANDALVLGFDEALHAESVALGAVVSSRATKNSIRINFFETATLRKRARLLAAAPAESVLIEVGAGRDAGVLAVIDGRRSLGITAGTAGPAHPKDPDGRVVLDGVPRDGWPLLWVVGDTVGDGQQVVEYIAEDSDQAHAAIAALARAGILPVAAGSRGPLRPALTASLETAISSARAAGHDDKQVAAALWWAGLGGAGYKLSSPQPASAAEVGLACDLLDEVAAEAILVLGPKRDLDGAVSVRAGGFPSWTGGVREWISEGRALTGKLVAVDVAAAAHEAAD